MKKLLVVLAAVLVTVMACATETNIVVSDFQIDPNDTNKASATVTIPIGTNKMMFFRTVLVTNQPIQAASAPKRPSTPTGVIMHRSGMAPIVIRPLN